MDPIIRTEKLSFEYVTEDDKARVALDGVDFTVGRGEFVAVLGHNGSGKSTLAKHLNALLVPSSGKCLVDGMDTSDDSHLLDIRQTVGMVMQNPDNQIIATIVEEDVAFGPENLGIEPEEIRRRVEKALRAVGMIEFRRHAPHKLSGGQKQRVAIAGIITMRPTCIVLDEPTAMLDPQGRAEVLRVVHRLCDELKLSVVLITHYMDETVDADRIVVIDGGRVLLSGTPREVFSQADTLRAVHLDMPQATRLIWRLRKAGVKGLPEDVLTDDECVEALASLLEENGCRSLN